MAVIHNQFVALPSAARTTAQTGDWLTNLGHKGLNANLNMTVETGASVVLTLTIEGRDAAGVAYTVATAANLDAVGAVLLRVYPGLTDWTTPDGLGNDAVPNVFNAVLPPVWRWKITVADADSGTYSLAIDLLP
jgi:hypothetical protein